MILLDAGQHVPGGRIMAGAKQRNPGIRRTGRGEAGALLLRPYRARRIRTMARAPVQRSETLLPLFPRENYSSSVNPTRKVT